MRTYARSSNKVALIQNVEIYYWELDLNSDYCDCCTPEWYQMQLEDNRIYYVNTLGYDYWSDDVPQAMWDLYFDGSIEAESATAFYCRLFGYDASGWLPKLRTVVPLLFGDE